jgi:hypothetical protein
MLTPKRQDMTKWPGDCADPERPVGRFVTLCEPRPQKFLFLFEAFDFRRVQSLALPCAPDLRCAADLMEQLAPRQQC